MIAMENDLINELPEELIQLILTNLPIKDAVRTSVLSTNWRYKWSHITHLSFDDRLKFVTGESSEALVNFISKCLALHDAPIHKFSIRSSYLRTSPHVIDQWLLFVSKKDVKDLIIDLSSCVNLKIPSCIFSCKHLQRLEVGPRCELHLPPWFEGFMCLKYLNLHRVSVPSKDIECLISSCPLLESLTLSFVLYDIDLTITAPNLKYLILKGSFKNISLSNTPLLVALSIDVYYCHNLVEVSNNNYDKLLGGVLNLERLSGSAYFMMYLCLDDYVSSNPIINHRLTIIELNEVDFADYQQVMLLIRLILNSPNLKELRISGIGQPANKIHCCDDCEVWDSVFKIDYKLHDLRSIEFSGVSCVDHEVVFMEYLLGHSPCLEEMKISTNFYDHPHMKANMSLLKQIVCFPRASPKARVTYDDIYDYETYDSD